MSISELPPNCRVRIKALDEQHKSLYRSLGQVSVCLMNGGEQGPALVLFRRFIEEKKNHFAFEEALLKAHAYPGYEKQKKDHETMAQRFTQVVSDLEAGRVALSETLIGRMREELISHISGPDAAYSEFLRGEGVS